MVRTTNLCKRYGTKNAVNQLNLVIPQGAIYGFIGRNGAGKSTTQKMVSGLANPTSGTIHLMEKPVSDPDVRSKIGVLIENAGLYPNMTAKENLMLYGFCIGLSTPTDKISEVLALVNLSDTGRKQVKHFSMGMKQRLGIAMAIMGNPRLLILDEPINGLDPEGIREFRQMILALNQERDMTVFISSHILGELSKIATHYGIIKDGVMVEQITTTALSQKCEDYLHVKVSDPSTSLQALQTALPELSAKIAPENSLRVYDDIDSATVMKIITDAGGVVSEIYMHKQDLEEYFLDFIGGTDHV